MRSMIRMISGAVDPEIFDKTEKEEILNEFGMRDPKSS